MKIEMGKKYRTEEGMIARIICTDVHGSCYQVVAALRDEEDEHGDEVIELYTSEGVDVNKHADLIEIDLKEELRQALRKMADEL
jgi:hypothetical protein